MNKKRLLVVLMCFVYIISAAVSAAAGDITAQITDGVNGIVKVSGTTPGADSGEKVNILVLNEGVSLEDAQLNIASSVIYQDSVTTEDGGEFSKEFRLYFAEGAEEECNLIVYVGGDSFDADNMAEIALYYASTALKIDKADEFVKGEDKADMLSSNKKIFSVDTELFDQLDIDELADYFAAIIEEEEISFKANTDANLEDNTEMYVSFESLLRYSIAMQAYNQSKKDYVVKGSTLEFDELLGLTDYIESNGTLANLLSDSITEIGKTSVTDGLFGTDAASKEELQKIYAKLIILNAIKRNEKNGSSIISKVLTKENIEAAGLDVPEYLALESKELADDTLYRMRTTLTIKNLEAKIEECAKEEEVVSKPSKETSSGGGGGGISVGTKKEEKPAEVQKPVNEESFTDLANYAWAKEAIEFLAKNDVINGTGDGAFNPSGKLTREAAAKIICLALGIDASEAQATFADVENSAW